MKALAAAGNMVAAMAAVWAIQKLAEKSSTLRQEYKSLAYIYFEFLNVVFKTY